MGRAVLLKSEMARAYGVSIHTLRKWLKELGFLQESTKNAKYLSSKEIDELEKEYGVPNYDLIAPKPAGNA